MIQFFSQRISWSCTQESPKTQRLKDSWSVKLCSSVFRVTTKCYITSFLKGQPNMVPTCCRSGRNTNSLLCTSQPDSCLLTSPTATPTPGTKRYNDPPLFSPLGFIKSSRASQFPISWASCNNLPTKFHCLLVRQ